MEYVGITALLVVEPAEIIVQLELLSRIADLVPPFVWRDYAGIDPRGDGLAPGSG
jgi:hypothetical protein